jgi:hypothetical protein
MTEQFSWYLDLTPHQMFSLYDYPVPDKDGLPLCQQHGHQLEMKEVALFDKEAPSSLYFACQGFQDESKTITS